MEILSNLVLVNITHHCFWLGDGPEGGDHGEMEQ